MVERKIYIQREAVFLIRGNAIKNKSQKEKTTPI